MNKFKRLICIVLAFTVIFSSFSAFANQYISEYEFLDDVFRFDMGEFSVDSDEEEVLSDDPVAKKIELLYELGIWDDVEKSKDSLVTMTEFSIIMSNLRLGSHNPFKQIYTQSENINKDNVTYKQVYEQLLDALGYYYRCNQYGNSDESVLIVATEIGLISKDAESLNTYITREKLAKLIFKAITIDICKMEYTGLEGSRYVVKEGQNLLNTVHGIYDLSGFVNAIEGLVIYGASSPREGYIQIDRRNVNTSGKNFDEFLGKYVTAYATYNDAVDEFTIIYMSCSDEHTEKEVDFNEIIELNTQKLIFVGSSNTETEIAVNNLKYVCENGNVLSSISEMCNYSSNDGKIIFTSSTGDGIIDTAIIYKYNYFVSSYVDKRLQRIGLSFNQECDGETFIQLDETKVTKVVIDGVASDYTKIPLNAALRYFKCSNTGYTEILASTEKVADVVNGIYENVIMIGEDEYVQSKDLLLIIKRGKTDTSIPEYEKVKELEIGTSTFFYVFDNVLVGYDSSHGYKWGYLKSIKQDRTSLDPALTLRIFTQTGEWVDFRITQKFELDGKKGVTAEEFLTVLNNNSSIMNNLVRYKTVKVNELSALDTIVEGDEELAGFEDVKMVYESEIKLDWTYTWLQHHVSYALAEKTFIFVAPEGENDESKYRVLNPKAFPTGKSIPLQFFSPDEVHQISAAICTMNIADIESGSSSSDDPLVYVESIRYALLDPEEDEYGYKVYGKQVSTDSLGAGKISDISFAIADDLLNRNKVDKNDPEYDPNKVIEPGDFIRAAVSNGKSSKWTMLLKEGRVPQEAIYEETTTAAFSGTGTVLAKKTVEDKVYKQHEYMLIECNGMEKPLITRAKVHIDPVDKKIALVSMADFELGDSVFIISNYGRCSLIKNADL